MFFPRLRRQAKWAFLLLAIMFAGGFVFFGVGAGGSGIGDYFADLLNRQPSATGGVSLDEARGRVEESPKDAEAQLTLANAAQAEGETATAISALEAYLEIRPRDTDALQQLAGLYEIQASDAQERAANAELESQATLFQQELQAGAGKLGTPLFSAPISNELQQATTEGSTVALTEMQEAYRREAETYRRLTVLLPDDPTMFFELGRTSQLAGDVEVAIASYEHFLELAPDDPNASIIREQLKLLRAQQGAGVAG
jgi:tetratricopeptide (TPR) repeat protein